MSDHIYNYRDSDLSLYLMNSDYILLLQIYATTFSYAIVYQNKFMAWAEDCDLALLDEPGYEHQALTFDYKHVVAGLQPTGFTLVPALLFSEDKIGDFARLLDVKPTERVLAELLDDDNYIVYKVDEKTAATAQIYGLQKAVFINKGWITAIANSNPQKNNLYLNIDKNQVAILYFVNSKIRFYNTFEFNNPDELAYYTTYVARELQLQPQSLILIVSGDINIDDKNATRLANFFNGVEQNEISTLTLPSTFFKHQLLALSALSLCVSSEVY
jgi:hypothetical protein